MSKNQEGKTTYHSILLDMIPEASGFERVENTYFERYLGRLEARVLRQIEYYLRTTKCDFGVRKYVAASYSMMAEWFCGTESERNIRRAVKNLMDLGILKTVPDSKKHRGANCYYIDFAQAAFIIKSRAAQENKIQTHPTPLPFGDFEYDPVIDDEEQWREWLEEQKYSKLPRTKCPTA